MKLETPADPQKTSQTAKMDSPNWAEAIEDDRRQLSSQLNDSVIVPLRLLLSQAALFEQTLAGQPGVRMAVSVLASLARQVLQQATDLEASLNPVVLHSVGLESALEYLAAHYARAYDLHVRLELIRLPRRPSLPVELALFRALEDALEALRRQRVLQVEVALLIKDAALVLNCDYPASALLPETCLDRMRQRVHAAGGELSHGRMAQAKGHLCLWFTQTHEPTFTPRELQILEGLTRGLSNKAMGDQLCISPRTINYHLDHIYAKLGVRTRTEAAVIALSRGWVHPMGLPPETKDTG